MGDWGPSGKAVGEVSWCPPGREHHGGSALSREVEAGRKHPGLQRAASACLSSPRAVKLIFKTHCTVPSGQPGQAATGQCHVIPSRLRLRP